MIGLEYTTVYIAEVILLWNFMQNLFVRFRSKTCHQTPSPKLYLGYKLFWLNRVKMSQMFKLFL